MSAAFGHDRIERFERFRKALVAAQDERHLRQEMLDIPGGQEIAWVAHERQVMLDVVNAERAAHGLEPVTEAEISRVEHRAMGHSDYSKKYALYCAELVETGGTR